MFDLDTSIHIVGHVLVAVRVEDLPARCYSIYATSLIMPVFMRLLGTHVNPSLYRVIILLLDAYAL